MAHSPHARFPPSGRRWHPRPTQWVGLGLVLVGGFLAPLGVPPVIPALAGLLLMGLPSLWRAHGAAEGPGGPDAPFAGRGKKMAGALLLALLVVPVGPCTLPGGETAYHVLFTVLAEGFGPAAASCPGWAYAAAYLWLAAFFGISAWQRPFRERGRTEKPRPEAPRAHPRG